MHDNLRFSMTGDIGGESFKHPLGDLVMRALTETGGWSVPAMRVPGFRLLEEIMDDPQFRAAAPLPERAQVVVDNAVVQVGQQRLSFIADLMSEGLVYNLSDPLSVTQLEWYKSNKIGAAQRVMRPDSRTENKMPNTLPSRLPVYLTLDGFNLDIRTLKMSQRLGVPLDTAIIQQCTRSVNESFEDAGINGASTLDGQPLVDAGYSAPGLLNAPNAEVHTISVAWNDPTATAAYTIGGKIYVDVEAMIAKLQANKKYGPYNLYVGTTYGNAMDGDYKANTLGTIRQRLELLNHGGRPLRIKSSDMLPVSTAVLVQMTNDVIDLVVGQPPTVIPWTSLDGFTIHNLVMGIMIPRVRSDYNGDSGICIATG